MHYNQKNGYHPSSSLSLFYISGIYTVYTFLFLSYTVFLSYLLYLACWVHSNSHKRGSVTRFSNLTFYDLKPTRGLQINRLQYFRIQFRFRRDIWLFNLKILTTRWVMLTAEFFKQIKYFYEIETEFENMLTWLSLDHIMGSNYEKIEVDNIVTHFLFTLSHMLTPYIYSLYYIYFSLTNWW